MLLNCGDYSIHFDRPPGAFLAELAGRKPGPWLVLTDENSRRCCLPHFKAHCPRGFHHFSVPAGEQHKNLHSCQSIWREMLRIKLGREALVVNLGGGVLGDMGGFCAATFKRGVDFVQIPTTLLSQVDASVGGKLGVDFQGLKNSLGLFANPLAVWIHPPFLESLPVREWRSGLAEVLKHALIQDAGLWETLKRGDWRRLDWNRIIPKAITIKRDIVLQDPFEKGIRKALNFGHTTGHALESLSLRSGQPLLHGEAVAAGMVWEACLSQQHAGLPREDYQNIRDRILEIYGGLPLPLSDKPALLELMRNDKKNSGGKINFSLLPRIGAARINQNLPPEAILEGLEDLGMFKK